MANNKPNTPDKPSGPSSISTNIEYTYKSSTTDPDGDKLYYLFDWDDGTRSEWFGPLVSGEEVEANHTLSNPGRYNIKVKPKDELNLQSNWSYPLLINIRIKNKFDSLLQSDFLCRINDVRRYTASSLLLSHFIHTK